MSSIVTDLLNITFGFLWNKACVYTMERLEVGDLEHKKCRQLVERKLGDIITNIDGLAKKDLCSSLLFLKEGVALLSLSLGNFSQVKGSKIMPDGTLTSNDNGRDSVVNRVLPEILSNAVSELKNASEERFISTQKSLENSNVEASKVFNKVLSTEDRIMAAKLLLISKILGSHDDTDAASETCKIYLKELHDLIEVQEMFSVFLGRGFKWVSTMFRNLFKKTERLRQVMSVTLINFLVFDFTKKFTKKAVGILNWPVIEVDEQVYNPVIGNMTMLGKVQELGAEAPDPFTHLYSDGKELDSQVSTVNSKGDITVKPPLSEPPSAFPFGRKF